MEVSTSSDESSLILPPPKKRWSNLSRTISTSKKTTKSKRPSKTASWKLRETQDDPVSAPTASEVEVARALLKLTRKRINRRHCKNHLKVPKPPGMAPLYGSFKEIEIGRKSSRTNSHSRILPTLPASRQLPSGTEDEPGVKIKAAEMECWESLTSKGASVLNEPSLVMPCLTPPAVSESSTMEPFNQDLNNLHAAAEKLTESMRTGQINPGFLGDIMTKIPPAVLKPEFHQEIERVRSRQKQQMTIDATFALFTNKSFHEM